MRFVDVIIILLLVFGLAVLSLWSVHLHNMSEQHEQILRTMHICLESPRYDTFTEAKQCLDQDRDARIKALLDQ